MQQNSLVASLALTFSSWNSFFLLSSTVERRSSSRCRASVIFLCRSLSCLRRNSAALSFVSRNSLILRSLSSSCRSRVWRTFSSRSWRESETGVTVIGDHQCFMQRPVHPSYKWMGKIKCGRVLICVDGSGRVKKKLFVVVILMYHSLQYVGLLRALYRALYTSCYCHII